jgi:transposase
VTACVRVPAADGKGREQHVAEFKTTVRGLLALRDWLAAHRVQQVVMEATGVFWKPIWHVLEDDFPLMLVNARHVKQVPGRKTDISDAAWLCQLLEAGLLKASFVPPKPIRALRNLTKNQTDCVSCADLCPPRWWSLRPRIRLPGARSRCTGGGWWAASGASLCVCPMGRPGRSR